MPHIGSHDFALVAISVSIAILASYTALDLVARVRASAGWARASWLGAAAVAMGGGIWSMHFVAMLAFDLPMEVQFDLRLTLLSLLMPIAVTAIGFFIECRRSGGILALGVSGLVMGFGIAAMHYTGMAAIRVPARVDYDWFWVAVSVLIAVSASTTALWLAFRDNHFVQRIIAAVAMGFAVAGMHYAAMLGATFTPDDLYLHPYAFSSVSQTHLAMWITTTTFLILALGLLAATFDRRFALQATQEARVLRESEERFRLLLQSVTDYAIYMLDIHGNVANWNSGAERIKGYTAEEIVGKHFSIFFLPEDREAGRPDAALEMARERGSCEVEGWRLRKDGSRYWASVVIDPIRDEDGELIGYAKVTRDISERRQAQEELAKAREALAHAQKMEAVGQLTGGVAHDFNNLLTAVLGSLELLKKRLPNDPQLHRLVNNAVMGAERGASLTKRMLAFARRQALTPTAVELPRLVQEMADLLQRSLGPAVRIDTRFPLDLPRAMVDAHQLELAVLNLVVNARDAMLNGGTIIIGGRADDASAAGGGRHVCLYVSDTGEGMDEETLARAQEPFFTTKGVGKGTGLGLSMVQGLAEQSEGRLVITSRKDEGTTAEIWLPVADAVNASHDPEKIVLFPREVVRPLVVLVVDDDPLVLENTAAMLEDMGHQVIEARSGEEALQFMRRTRRLDLVITDHAMPGMTGLELAKAVLAERPAVRIVLATGYAELRAPLHLDVVRLDKPFDQAALARTIGEVMSAMINGPNVLRFPPEHATGSNE